MYDRFCITRTEGFRLSLSVTSQTKDSQKFKLVCNDSTVYHSICSSCILVPVSPLLLARTPANAEMSSGLGEPC